MTEVEVLGRRRRLLEAARQMLLESSAAVPLDAAGVEARRQHIAGEITRIDRLQAAGVSPEVSLAHQIREAMTRGERDRLHAALVAMNGVARGAGDERAYALSRRAILQMWQGNDPRTADARQRSIEQSAKQALGEGFTATVKRTYELARKRYETLRKDGDDSSTVDSALGYFDDASAAATLSATLAVDGAFEVGGALLPVRIEEIERRYRAVRWPTRELLLLPATEPADIPDAVIDDPRTIVLDLAAGRLLARRFVKEELIRHPKTILRGEVRVYVLDGSGSMVGPRSRMRDAIVSAELLTLKRRLLEGAKLARVVLFYRYFDTEVHPTVRVDTPAAVELALGDVLGNLRDGGTDIDKALLASFEQVRAAKVSDPELAQAQIVLVTDGEAAVDEAKIDHARRGVGDLTVGLSVIALGQENPALRALVAKQRAKGERAFYHFIPDETLEAVSRGEVDSGLPVHLPEVQGSSKPQALSADLERPRGGDVGPRPHARARGAGSARRAGRGSARGRRGGELDHRGRTRAREGALPRPTFARDAVSPVVPRAEREGTDVGPRRRAGRGRGGVARRAGHRDRGRRGHARVGSRAPRRRDRRARAAAARRGPDPREVLRGRAAANGEGGRGAAHRARGGHAGEVTLGELHARALAAALQLGSDRRVQGLSQMNVDRFVRQQLEPVLQPGWRLRR